MGLFTNLLTVSVSAPFKGMAWIARQLEEHVEQTLYNEDKVHQQLTLLELRYDLGDIDTETFERLQHELTQQLRLIHRRKAAREKAHA